MDFAGAQMRLVTIYILSSAFSQTSDNKLKQ